MTSIGKTLDSYLEAHHQDHIAELSRLCAQPSVSATGEGIAECAEMVVEMLRQRDFQVQKMPTPGNPVVVARAGGRSERTLLCYNHYDVQPPEPLELWTSPPFEPQVRDGALYARGANDDKGEFVARLAAVDAVRATYGRELPCGITFVVEGEEEVGSPNIAAFVEQNRELLACHGSIWETGGIGSDGRPKVQLGFRGILAVRLAVRTMNRDGHSGGAHILPSAAWRLHDALSAIRGPDERVRVAGFFDDARPPSELDASFLDGLPDKEALLREELDIRRFVRGLRGRELNRAVFEPTCNIQGIVTGYQGQGMKTVIPAEASANLDFRLVPDQDPLDIFTKLRAHLDAQGFDDLELTLLGKMWPAKSAPDDPLVQLTAQAAGEVYGIPALLDPLIVGSSPVYAFANPLGGIPVVTAGVGYHSNRIHAPDEHVRLKDFLNGARHIARIMAGFADL